MSKPIVFFGNERLATGVKSSVILLRSLIETGYDIALVVVNYEAPASRAAREHEIEKVAQKYSLTLLGSTDKTKIVEAIKDSRAAAGVLAAYGKIVSEEMINLFPRGIINIHPSLLPRYRGPTPIEQAVLDGATKTGVSLMQLSKEMDKGPVFAQAELPLSGQETKQELADKLLEQGAELLIRHLPYILDGSLKPAAQDDKEATYTSLIIKASGQLDWAKPAAQLEREIRAYAGWPHSWGKLGSQDVIVTEAHVQQSSKQQAVSSKPGTLVIEGKKLAVQTGSGLLVVDKIQPTGKKDMSAEAFLAGYKDKISL